MVKLSKLIIFMAFFAFISPKANAKFDLTQLYLARDKGNFGPVVAQFEEEIAKNGKPLFEDEDRGGVFLLLWEVMIKQPSPDHLPVIKKLIRQAVQLGGDPKVKITVEGDVDPLMGLPLNTVFIILNEWIRRFQNNDENKDFFARSAKIMFDIWFETGALELNYQTHLVLPETYEILRVGLVHRLLLDEADNSIIEYFLEAGVRHGSLDENRWNMAMVAAAAGNLDALKSMGKICGKADAAILFNYKCDINYRPTVLHAAVQSIINGFSAEHTFRIIEYLTENGANPLARSVYHSLIDEVDYWANNDRANRQKYRELRNLLEENMQRLVSNFKACEALVKIMATSKGPPAPN